MHTLKLDQPLANASMTLRGGPLDVEVSQVPHDILTPTGQTHYGVYAVHRQDGLLYNSQGLNRVFLSLTDVTEFGQIPIQRVQVRAHRIVTDSPFREDERGPHRADLELIGTGYLEPAAPV